MPNYISSFPLTKNKKLVDTEPMLIITGLKPKYMEKKMRKMRKEKLNKKNRCRDVFLILMFLLSTRKTEYDEA